MDFVERTQYLHLRSTLDRLLELGCVPVVNENDAIANDELRYGDNDRIAALLANGIGADVLVLLTDMDGLFTADPRRESEAALIPLVAADDPLDTATIAALVVMGVLALGAWRMTSPPACARWASRWSTGPSRAAGSVPSPSCAPWSAWCRSSAACAPTFGPATTVRATTVRATSVLAAWDLAGGEPDAMPKELPSALIDKPMPSFSLPAWLQSQDILVGLTRAKSGMWQLWQATLSVWSLALWPASWGVLLWQDSQVILGVRSSSIRLLRSVAAGLE